MRPESEPDGLTFGDLWPDVVEATRFGRLHWTRETGSTNDDLALVAAAGGPEQLLVTDLQTAGRGRRDRTWEAPAESGALMSFLLRDRRDVSPFWTIGSVALAASEAITALSSVPCQLKWPNDLLLGEGSNPGKVAGILAQIVDEAVIVGIGINANWAGARPAGVPDHATSIDQHLVDGTAVDRRAFVRDLVLRLEPLLALDGAELRRRWVESCDTIGRHVRAELDGDEPLTGVAIDVATDGALVIERGPTRHVVHVGDVVHLRRAED